MFISKDSEGIFVVFMCVALALVLFSTVGCSGRWREKFEECERLRNQCESDLAEFRETLQQTEGKLEDAESEIERLTQKIDGLENDKREIESDLKECQEKIEDLQLDLQTCRNNNDELTKELEEEKSEIKALERKLEKCRSDAAEALEETRNQLLNVKDELDRTKTELEICKGQIPRVPQAQIIADTVRFKKDRDRLRHGIRIIGQFSTSNRNGHEVWAVAYFYFEDGRILKDRNRNKKYVHEGQVAVREKFDIDYVKQNKNETFNLFIPFYELHVEQKHTLKFSIRIYDKSTKSYLENTPHEEKFEYDPKGKKIRKRVD